VDANDRSRDERFTAAPSAAHASSRTRLSHRDAAPDRQRVTRIRDGATAGFIKTSSFDALREPPRLAAFVLSV
jgi:hypothetical protein